MFIKDKQCNVGGARITFLLYYISFFLRLVATKQICHLHQYKKWYNSIFCVCWLKAITVQCWRSLYYIPILLYIIFLETSCYKTNLPSASIQKMYGNKNLELSLMCKWGIWYLARAPGKIQNISFSCWFMLHTTGRSVSDVFIVAGGSNGRKSNFENTQCCQVVHIS